MCPTNIEHEIVNISRDANGRFLILEVRLNGNTYVLCNIYAPNQEHGYNQDRQLAFFEEVRNKLEFYKDSTASLIMGGDFNTYLIPTLDKHYSQIESAYATKTSFAIELLRVCDEYNLLDCWRTLNPDVRRYTWRQSNPVRQSRIDYWLITSPLLNMIDLCDIQPSYKSDHSLITLDLRIGPNAERGPGIWKFNVSLLKDTKYVEQLNTCIVELKTIYAGLEDKALKWEIIKCELRRETISYCKSESKKRKELILSLSKDVTKLEKHLADNPNADIMQEYQVTKHELDSLITHKAEGAALHAKANHL